jgi:hypothetical protein
MEKFDTHKFLYTLYHDGEIEGHEILHVDKDNKEIKTKVKQIEIGPSPVSCKIIDEEDKKHRIMFVRVKAIYFKGKQVWENTDFDLSDVKIIKGYD